MPFAASRATSWQTISRFSVTVPVASFTIPFTQRFSLLNISFAGVVFDTAARFVQMRPSVSFTNTQNPQSSGSVVLSGTSDYADGFSTATISSPSVVTGICPDIVAGVVAEALTGNSFVTGCNNITVPPTGGFIVPGTPTFMRFSPRYHSQIIRHNAATLAFIGGASLYGMLTPWLQLGTGTIIDFIDGIEIAVGGGAGLFQVGDFIIEGTL